MMQTRLLLLGMLLFLLAACRRKAETAAIFTAEPDIHALQQRTFESLWSIIDEQYVYDDFGGVDWAQIHDEYETQLAATLPADEFDDLMRQMVARLPAGTVVWQNREARIEQAAADNSGYGGIGAFVVVRRQPEPRIILLATMPDSPAETAGLQAHDRIVAVDGRPIAAEADSNPIASVRGPADSEVNLTIRSPGEPAREVILRRQQIEAAIPRLHWEMLADGRTGYFLFPSGAYEELLSDFLLGIQALSADGALDKVILDLRIVTIGQSWPAVSLLTLFMEGEIGEVYSRTMVNAIPVEGVDDFEETQRLPVAVLVGPDTTGPAELFAAAIQDAERGPIVGATTGGRVEALTMFGLPDGSQASIAVSSFRTAAGREIGLLGVTPDILAAEDWDEVTAVADPVREAAHQALSAEE